MGGVSLFKCSLRAREYPFIGATFRFTGIAKVAGHDLGNGRLACKKSGFGARDKAICGD